MKTVDLSLCAIFAGCVAMAACSQATELSRLHYTPNVDIVSGWAVSPLSYSVLHSFGSGADGVIPFAGLIDVNGTLYGTTANGGGKKCSCGTVFAVTTGGKEKVVYNFGGPPDGGFPHAGLVNVRGTLYGTTAYGGTSPAGTVFALTTGGKEKVLHSFGVNRGPDGSEPFAGLVNVHGTLYGTTFLGGLYGNGTVFAITTGGKEKVLHSFGSGTDGSEPSAGLVNIGDTLYGTTLYGGAYGNGTVFSITRGGAEKLLHSFGRGADGYWPGAGLIDVGGRLYGTTAQGGAHSYGTIFSLSHTPGGSEHVVYSFGGPPDGQQPLAGLVNASGTLYGTTEYGGTFYCNSDGSYKCGTVFSVTPGGAEKVLHSFGGGTDGQQPLAGLLNVRSTLYGTTYEGGANGGGGTVFSTTTNGTEKVLR